MATKSRSLSAAKSLIQKAAEQAQAREEAARKEVELKLAARERKKAGLRADHFDVDSVERPVGENWITMGNALVRAGHGLSLVEKRIVMLAVSRLDSRSVPANGKLPPSRVTASDYAEQYGVTADTAYDSLQDGAASLFNRKITFFEPANKRKGAPLTRMPPPGSKARNNVVKTDIRWVNKATYHKGAAWVELSWVEDIVPLLVGLKSQFTTYQLQQASALRSAYSWRLLELLTRFKSSGIAEYTIEDFCVSMDATEKQRTDFAAVRRKIIEPAVRELTQKDGWIIKWEPIKTGHKVTGLRFVFERNPQGQLDL